MLDDKLLDLHLRSYRACLVRVDLAIVVACSSAIYSAYWRLNQKGVVPSDRSLWITDLPNLLGWAVFFLAGLIGWSYHNRCRSIAKNSIPIKILPGIAAYPGLLHAAFPMRFTLMFIPVLVGAYIVPDSLPRLFGDETREVIASYGFFRGRLEQPMMFATYVLERVPYYFPSLVLWLKAIGYGNFVRSW